MGIFYKTLSHTSMFSPRPWPAAFSAVMLVEPFHLGPVEQMVASALVRRQLSIAYQLSNSTGRHSEENGGFGCRNEAHTAPRLLSFALSSILPTDKWGGLGAVKNGEYSNEALKRNVADHGRGSEEGVNRENGTDRANRR